MSQAAGQNTEGQGGLANAILDTPILGGMNLRRTLEGLEQLDRSTFRHVRQPIAETFRPSSAKTPEGEYIPHYQRFAELIPGAEVGPYSERDAFLDEQYALFEQQQGRPPSYMEKLDIQQQETPWYLELAAEGPLALSPAGLSRQAATDSDALVLSKQLAAQSRAGFGGQAGRLSDARRRVSAKASSLSQPRRKVSLGLSIRG